jgi:SUMO ligase MMS21 Smc5/6 complex component
LDQLQKCLKDLITEENKAIKASHAMARIQGLLNDSLLEGRGLENLEEMFEKALKEQKEPKLNVEKHEMMSKFESRVAKLTQNAMERNKPIGGDENDEGSASECEESDTENEGINTLDPVTNQTIVDPVKNTTCGHSYEKSSITRLMKKPGMLCPAIGCSVPLKDAKLVEDFDLKRYLESIKK